MSRGHLDQEAHDACLHAASKCPAGMKTLWTAIHYDADGKRSFRFAYEPIRPRKAPEPPLA